MRLHAFAYTFSRLTMQATLTIDDRFQKFHRECRRGVALGSQTVRIMIHVLIKFMVLISIGQCLLYADKTLIIRVCFFYCHPQLCFKLTKCSHTRKSCFQHNNFYKTYSLVYFALAHLFIKKNLILFCNIISVEFD